MGWWEKRTFRPFWGFWYAVAFLDISLQFVIGVRSALIGGVVWLVVFGLVEGWAAWRKTLDDTLSEFSAWLSSLVSVHPGSPFHDRLASVLAGFLGVYGGWVLSWGFHSPGLDVVGAAFAVLVWLWLRDHFRWLAGRPS